jgi:Rrf2 family protein
MNISLQRKTDLAFKVIGALASAGGARSRDDLAATVETTPAFLAQVMTPLVRAGWVRSGRGPGGGYRLATPAERISLLAVIEAVEGETVNGRCVLRDGPCPGAEECPIHDAWVAARAALMERLERVSVEAAMGGSR